MLLRIFIHFLYSEQCKYIFFFVKFAYYEFEFIYVTVCHRYMERSRLYTVRRRERANVFLDISEGVYENRHVAFLCIRQHCIECWYSG